MPGPVLPNFFIVGTGKAGTTSLYRYLQQHPQIFMSPIKEPCYFASEICPENLDDAHLRHQRRMSRKSMKPYGWLVKEWADYVGLFQNAENQTAIGEASVAYLWSESAAPNIASQFPHAKIVMILRDPSERAFSQYNHQLAAGLIRSTFREHIETSIASNHHKVSALHPFLEVGLYSAQVQRYLDRFPRHNIRIYWYEEAWKEPEIFLRDLFEFLRVDTAFVPDLSYRSLQRRSPRFVRANYLAKQFELTHRLRRWLPDVFRPFFHRKHVQMDPEDRSYLVEYYRADIAKLESLLNRDLSAWLRS